MAVFRTEKTRDYTVMSNFHLRDRTLSLKSKGLLSLMLSLPDEWDYSLSGLACICQDGMSSVRSGVSELEQHGYLTRRRIREANGQLGDIEYTIHERPRISVNVPPPDDTQPECDKPTLEKPICENPIQVNPIYENRTQLSIQDNQVLTESNIHQSIHHSEPEKISKSYLPEPQRKEMDSMELMDSYSEIIKKNIGYDYLLDRYKYQNDEIEGIFQLILETVCTSCKAIRIGGEEKPVELVKSRMLKLHPGHIEYVMDALSKNTTEVRNIKNYILTTLYNAPTTIGSYYKAMVNHDLYGS